MVLQNQEKKSHRTNGGDDANDDHGAHLNDGIVTGNDDVEGSDQIK